MLKRKKIKATAVRRPVKKTTASLKQKSQKMETEWVNLSLWIRDCALRVRGSVRESHVHFQIRPYFPQNFRVKIHREGLSVVAEQLVKNAFASTPPGGTVELKIEWQKKTNALVLTVVDSGLGVPEKLVATERWVTRLGGSMDVESRAQMGSVFTIKVPVASTLQSLGAEEIPVEPVHSIPMVAIPLTRKKVS